MVAEPKKKKKKGCKQDLAVPPKVPPLEIKSQERKNHLPFRNINILAFQFGSPSVVNAALSGDNPSLGQSRTPPSQE
jgi:hypothetical protein